MWYFFEFLSGLLCGYILGSLVESYMHQKVSDAPYKYVKKWQRFPRLSQYFIRTRYSHHVIHHVKTFRKNHVTQFGSPEEQQKLDQELLIRGKHGKIISDSQYAIKLHGSGSLVFVAPLVPVAIFIWGFFGIWAAIGSGFALLLPPLFSNFIHPYLHMSHLKAVEQAPVFISWLLKTRYFREVARSHYMHHRYVVSNYNLVLGGDILRGLHRKPEKKDIEAMRELGLPLD
jgi:hypothetical protein